jgi:mannose-6-phosphate isomerase-like protein (cupin superfamily)
MNIFEPSKEFRRWGEWRVLAKGHLGSQFHGTHREFKVKLLYINAGKSISLQFHDHRDEYWIVMEGRATCITGKDEEVCVMSEGDMVDIPRGSIHKITNKEDCTLIILELQMGTECDEEDITRLEKIDGEG